MPQKSSGKLVLADGSVFDGFTWADIEPVCGEVVFNTSQTGYQEILTDPSYADQIIVFTQPHIGNVGVNYHDMESAQIFAKALITRSFSTFTSNYRAEDSLQNFLTEQQVSLLDEVDTRALTQHLRQFGSQMGCLVSGDFDWQAAQMKAKSYSNVKTFTQQVCTQAIQQWLQSGCHHVVVYDFGVKRSILHALANKSCKITLVPPHTTAQQTLALQPDGILLSNGPGDPAAYNFVIPIIQQLIRIGIPMMGICLGHQLLALASGALTTKMHLGHHGANHPIQSVKHGSVAISSQNHGYVVTDESLPANLRVTHRSLFDNSIAGIERIDVPAFGFQGHPEASPGPTDLYFLFDHFISLIEVAHAKAN